MNKSDIYTISEIEKRIRPVADFYHLKAVYLFGSYARGEADKNSDIDLIVDTSGTDLDSLMKLGGLYTDLEDALEKPIDMVTVDTLEQQPRNHSDAEFRNTVWSERIGVYDAA